MRYRLVDDRIVKSIYGEQSAVVEVISEGRDRPSAPVMRTVLLWLATAAAAALLVGVAFDQGWAGATNGALLAGSLFVFLAMIGDAVAPTVDDEQEWRLLLPWAIVTLVVTAWVASAAPRVF